VWQKHIQTSPDDVRRREPEYALTGGIDALDAAGTVERENGILDVVQDGLQVRRSLRVFPG
jgi:hypothetical protein